MASKYKITMILLGIDNSCTVNIYGFYTAICIISLNADLVSFCETW